MPTDPKNKKQVKTRDLSKPLTESKFDKIIEASMDTVRAGLHHAAEYRGGRGIKGKTKPAWRKSAKKIVTTEKKGPLKNLSKKKPRTYIPSSTEINRSLKRIEKLSKQKKNK